MVPTFKSWNVPFLGVLFHFFFISGLHLAVLRTQLLALSSGSLLVNSGCYIRCLESNPGWPHTGKSWALPAMLSLQLPLFPLKSVLYASSFHSPCCHYTTLFLFNIKAAKHCPSFQFFLFAKRALSPAFRSSGRSGLWFNNKMHTLLTRDPS